MKHTKPRRLTALLLAALMCFGIVAATLAAILPVSAADTAVESFAPSGTKLVSVGSTVTISSCTNLRAGDENSYEMVSENWSKKFLTDGLVDGSGWSCQPYDRESDHTKPVTITLTLPAPADVSAVTLFPNGQFPNRYEIQVSADGKTYTKVAEDAGIAIHNQDAKTYTFPAVRATHVRLHIIERNPATGPDGALAQLGELAVWGKAEAAMVLDRSALELYVGESDTLKTSFVGMDPIPAVTYKSADTSVAAVDENGTITAKKLGTTTVTVTAPSIGLSEDCEVTVVTKKQNFNENISLSVFWPPTPAYINDEQYKLMADAGINWVMGAGEETLATPENQRKMLELCRKYGIGMTVQDGNFGDNLLGKSEEQIASYVKPYQNVPSADGFYLRDEPFNPNGYLDAYVALKKASPDASVHLNFLPLGSYGSEHIYKAQMTDWCRLTAGAGYPIEYLMFDNYPFPLSGEMNRAGFFQNARACWEVGLAEGVKTGMYIQTVRQDVAFRRPSASEIRYEMYAALAFGYKQLSFFTWFTPVNRSEPFSDGIISPDGKPNAHYETVKTINHEILAIGKTLVRCDALEVYFNGPNTYGQPAVPADFFVQADRTDAVILSYLRHKETGRNYLMVVNNSYASAQTVELTFDAAISSLSEVSRKDGSLKALAMDGRTLKLSLAAGDAMFIALPEGFDYKKPVTDQPAATENLAALDGASILCPTSEGADGWYMYNLTDGNRITGNESSANGWRTKDYKDTYIVIDLGRTLDFNRLDLYAAGTFFDYGLNFPKNIKISVSDDNLLYSEVKSFTDLTAGKRKGNTLTFDRQTARYIRLDLTGMARTDRYAALNEIEVYCDDGTVPAPQTFTLTDGNGIIVDYTEGDNIALGKPAFASSTTPDHYKAWGWSLEYINDGHDKLNGNVPGWTSNVGRNPTSNATEFVGIDFCDVFAVDRIVIQPHGAFPVNYSVELSTDGVNWTVVSDVQNAKNDGKDVVIRLDTPVNARFIRMTATKLRSGGNAADGYLFQLKEIEAYGKPVCDKTDLKAAIDTYKADGGDASASLLTEAAAAMEDPLLTQTQANDLEKRLLAAVGKTPEDDRPDMPIDPDKPDDPNETDPPDTTPVNPPAPGPDDTLPPETNALDTSTPDTAAPDSDVKDDDTDVSPPAGTISPDEQSGTSDQDKGCGSILGLGTLTMILFIGTVTLCRKREN